MIHSILESTLRRAINDVENIDKAGRINWSFVDADCYMECRALYKSDADYYEAYDDLADKVLELENGDGNIRYGVLDSSLWHKRGDTGPSLAEQMISRGCRWRPSDRSRGSRVAGKNEVHRRLQIDEFTEEPRLVFFSTCTNIVSQLPSIPLDKKNPEDVDTKSEDHLYDALRYGIMSRPRFSVFDYDPMGRPSTGMPIADSTFGY